ncbi:MAG: PHP domain-containing protein [Clostridiales bacterium]|nr:PHP domain-containing protein [Candidatus Crickella equi]
MEKNEVIKLIKEDVCKDLHIHTVFSDGVLTPEQVVDRWMAEGKKTIAITDHDGIDGSIVAVEYAKDKDINVIPGIEFDSANELGRHMHILGYGMDYYDDAMQSKLKQMLAWRKERNDSILAELRRQGIDITDEEIYAVNEGRYVGKPTFGRILVQRGMFKDLADAFNNLLSASAGFKAIKKQTLHSKEVVETVHAAGGIVVLAHPMEQMKTGESWEEFEPRLIKLLDTFVEYGVDGIECWHPSASEENSEYLAKYADDHGLLKTWGSDFHFDGLNRIYTRG